MSEIVVRPVRFTDHIENMQTFLETLGLRPRIEAERGGWVDMISRGGMVALHSADTSDTGGGPGETRLSFGADDVYALAERLTTAGVEDVVVYDESYGKVLNCRDPLGELIAVDGRSDDLYGYRVHERGDVGEMRVVPVRFTDPRGPLGEWLEALGLELRGDLDDSYVLYAAGGGDHGLVGVHQVYSDDLPIVPGQAAVHLTFESTAGLDDVAAKLVEAGYVDATVLHEDFGSMLTVTDPDGRECQVHQAPRP